MKRSLYEEYLQDGRFSSCMIIDMHGHMGAYAAISFPLCAPERMVREMDRRGVAFLLFSHHASLFVPEAGNRPAVEAVRRFPSHFLAYWAVNPHHTRGDRELAEMASCRDACCGFKFHPDFHATPLTHDRYRPFWEYAEAEHLIVLSHTWAGSPFCGERQVAAAAAKYPHVPFIVGHSLHGAWAEMVSIAREFPSVWIDVCALPDERKVVDYLYTQLGSKRILFGTDFPWFSYPYYIGAVLDSDIPDDDLRDIFYRNAARLLAPWRSFPAIPCP